jgi:hypothetical protein
VEAATLAEVVAATSVAAGAVFMAVGDRSAAAIAEDTVAAITAEDQASADLILADTQDGVAMAVLLLVE